MNPLSREIPNNDLKYGELIGSSRCAEIYRGEWNGVPVLKNGSSKITRIVWKPF